MAVSQNTRRRTSRSLATSAFTGTQRAHKPDHYLIMLVGLLMLLGLVIMYAIGPQRAQLLNTLTGASFSDTYFVVKQAISLVLAVGALVFFAITPMRVIKQYASQLLLIALAACGVLFLADLAGLGIAQETLGATRWFNLGPLGSFQPSELLKFAMLIFLARFLAEQMKKGEVNDWEETLIPTIVITAISLFIIVVIQKDMGTGIALVSIVATLLMVAGVNLRIGAILIAGLVALSVIAVVIAPHRMARVTTFLQGDSAMQQVDDQNSGSYHIYQAKLAIGSGGLFGVGIGNSVQATGYLPEAINDSVFAIIGETFGFVGIVSLLILMTVLLIRILRISERLEDEWMRLIAAGTFGWLASHIILNVASMTGFFPLTGITLPLLSFGGTSMLFIAAALGMVFQASRYASHRAINRKEAYANLGSRRGVGRTRYASRRRPA